MNNTTIHRFAFYVSGNASRLVKVVELFPEIIKNTFLVINDDGPNTLLSDLLSGKGIEYIEFNYKGLGLKGDEKNKHISDLLLQKFNSAAIDYAFCFGGRILKGKLLQRYKNKIINFHPSILPEFPGIRAIDQALAAKASLLGNTAHFIDEGTDTGPVIMQSVLPAEQFSDYEDVLGLQLPMIQQIFTWLNQNRLVVENDKVSITGASYEQSAFFPKLEINQK